MAQKTNAIETVERDGVTEVTRTTTETITPADKPKAPAKKTVGDPPPTLSPVDELYMNFASVFGNANPRQLFSLVWPGTVLDFESYEIPEGTVTGDIPPTTMAAQSNLFDIYYPIATITQPDGTRVSDRYRQALESYGPIPNEQLIDLQEVIRERLDQTVEIVIDGVLTKVTLLEKFSILEGEYVARKQEWGKLKSEMYDRYKLDGGPNWWDDYIRWYEMNAQGYIDGINAAYNRMVADFPVNEFEDALAILDTHDAAALLRAKEDVRNGATPVPAEVGSSYFPSLAIPHDWGRVLKPSTTFTDLLAAPDVQQRYMNLAIEQLRQQIFAWNAVLAQIPDTSKDQIAAALADFNSASEAYYAASNKLIADYTDNTVLAVKSYLQYKQGTNKEKEDGANNMIDKLNKQNGGTSQKIDWAKFEEIAGKIGDAQKKLIEDTGSMVASGQLLGEKATAYLKTKAGEGLRELIAPVLQKLESQLTIVADQIRNFDAAAGRAVQLNGSGIPALSGGSSDDPQFASPTDSITNQRWSEITMLVKTSSMQTQSETSTSFSQTNWGVDLFFGSAGGESKTASQAFASKYMDNESEIQIGMLATKVFIERPWMHPEIFSMTNKFFKAVDMDITTPEGDAVTKGELLSTTLGGNVSQSQANNNCIALNNGILPGYPVALLLAKDITIKIKLKATETEAMQKHSESNESNGGGFLCFSVSKTQSSSSDSKAASSYAMGGDYVFRIPAPQIIGVWNQILPPDHSEYLDSDRLKQILKFKSAQSIIQDKLSIKPYQEEPPRKS